MKKYFLITTITLTLLILGCSKKESISPSREISSNGTGKGGSMAAMTIHGNYLYKLNDGMELQTYDISKDTSAVLVSVFKPNSSVTLETIYISADRNLLFIGTTGGMYILDISSPNFPKQLSFYQHLTACDPVVVNGNTAYVTLRTGTRCGGSINQMEVIDVTDPKAPAFIKAYQLTNPKGLDFDGNNLFVCDGGAGLKWYDITTKTNPVFKSNATSLDAYDIITLGSRLILIGNSGLYQYNVNGNSLDLLSQIPIVVE